MVFGAEVMSASEAKKYRKFSIENKCQIYDQAFAKYVKYRKLQRVSGKTRFLEINLKTLFWWFRQPVDTRKSCNNT
jgi:hypothetical protein